MLKEKILPISIFCLAISMIISASIISKGMNKNGEYVRAGLGDIGYGLNGINSAINQSSIREIRKDNYNLLEASEYLGIPESGLTDLVNNKNAGIPYVKIDGYYVFSKNALDKWLETAKVEM